MLRIAIFKREHKGFALIFTVLIAVAMIIPVMILASNAISRRHRVSGEAVSDRVLSVADSTIDVLLNKVNKFSSVLDNDPMLQQGIQNINKYYKDNYYSQGETPDPAYAPNEAAVKYAAAFLLSKINGGTPYQPDGVSDPFTGIGANYDNYANASFTEGDGTIWDIEDNIASYLYNVQTNSYYVVVSDASNKIPAYSGTAGFDYVENLSNGVVKSLSQWDPKYQTDNKWVESDVNVQYVDDGQNTKFSAKFKIRVTSFLISNKPEVSAIKRSVIAEATLQTLDAETSSSSNGGSSGGSSDDIPAAFKHAVWSGGDTIVNGDISFEAANINSDGSYDVLNKGGDLFGDGDIILNGMTTVNGAVITSKDESDDPIIENGFITIKEGKVYGKHESLPNFPTDTETTVKSKAQISGSNHEYNNSDFETNGWNNNINVNGIAVPYYIGGDAILNGSNTINFTTTEGNPPVDWYVDGDLTFNGDTVINVSSPGYVWVNGDIIFNGTVKVNGSVTFVSNKQIIFNGEGTIKYNDDKDMVAIISEGEQFDGGIVVNGFGEYDGIFYAPNSEIIFNGSTTVYGTVVAGGWNLGGSWKQGVIMNGFSNFIFDTRLAGYNPGGGGGSTPPLPTPTTTTTIQGVHFISKTLWRLSWREIISDPVNPTNIEKACKDSANGVIFKFSNGEGNS